MKPRLLDLFCGAGGAAMGYSRAGFEVVGVDIEPQPNYPFEFVQYDALKFLDDHVVWDSGLHGFDVIHASPPCQAYSVSRNNGCHADAPRLIEPTQERLDAWGGPFVIENVMGARSALRQPVMLCGASLGLGIPGWDLARHRLFESNMYFMVPPCIHRRGKTIGVYGHGTNAWHREKFGRNLLQAEKREAMSIDWMTRAELSEAIPPAYTELIGLQLIQQLQKAAA